MALIKGSRGFNDLTIGIEKDKTNVELAAAERKALPSRLASISARRIEDGRGENKPKRKRMTRVARFNFVIVVIRHKPARRVKISGSIKKPESSWARDEADAVSETRSQTTRIGIRYAVAAGDIASVAHRKRIKQRIEK